MKTSAGMTQLQLTVGLPPSLNNAYATIRGRRVLVTAGREYKEEVLCILMRLADAQAFMRSAKGARLALTLRLWFKTKQRTDISNRVKLLEDALSEALGFDDCNVDLLVVQRAGYDKERPRAEVVLEIIKE